jgi:YbbR domain-containing protein
MRLYDVGTDAIDLTGINSQTTREVRISPQRGNVRVEDDRPVTVRLMVEPEAPKEVLEIAPEAAATEAQAF